MDLVDYTGNVFPPPSTGPSEILFSSHARGSKTQTGPVNTFGSLLSLTSDSLQGPSDGLLFSTHARGSGSQTTGSVSTFESQLSSTSDNSQGPSDNLFSTHTRSSGSQPTGTVNSFESQLSLTSDSSQGLGNVNFFGTRAFRGSNSQPVPVPMMQRMRMPTQSDTYQMQIAREQRINELTQENKSLNTRLANVESMLNVLMQNHPGLAAHQPFSPALFSDSAPSVAPSPLMAIPSLTPRFLNNPSFSPGASLIPTDYPNVKFWYRKDWLKYVRERGNSTDVLIEPVRGKTLMSKGINKNARYLEGADGEPVDGWKLKDILAHMRAIWESFRSVQHAPPSWGKANVEIAHVYRREMRTKFPEFAFCDNDWKADHLATEHYPSWYNNHVKGEIKEETTDSASLAGSKRCSTEQAAPQSKKKKKVRNPLLEKKVVASAEDLPPLTPIDFPDSSTVINATVGAAERGFPGTGATGPVDKTDTANSNGAISLPGEPTSIDPKIMGNLQNPLLKKNLGNTSKDPVPLGSIHDSATPATITKGTPGAEASAEAPLADSDVGSVNSNGAGEMEGMNIMNEQTENDAPHSQFAPVTRPHDENGSPIEGDQRKDVPSDQNSLGPLMANSTAIPAAPPVSANFSTSSSLETISSANPELVAAPATPGPVSVPAAPLPVSEPLSGHLPDLPSAGKVSQVDAGKKGSKMRPNSSLTARNLCAQDWCAKHPNGTTSEFKYYYDHEISAELKKVYEQRSKEAKANEAKANETKPS